MLTKKKFLCTILSPAIAFIYPPTMSTGYIRMKTRLLLGPILSRKQGWREALTTLSLREPRVVGPEEVFQADLEGALLPCSFLP